MSAIAGMNGRPAAANVAEAAVVATRLQQVNLPANVAAQETCAGTGIQESATAVLLIATITGTLKMPPRQVLLINLENGAKSDERMV